MKFKCVTLFCLFAYFDALVYDACFLMLFIPLFCFYNAGLFCLFIFSFTFALLLYNDFFPCFVFGLLTQYDYCFVSCTVLFNQLVYLILCLDCFVY